MLFNDLRIDPSQHPMALAVPPLTPKESLEKMVNIWFETFGVPALFMVPEDLGILSAMGFDSGIVLNIGAEWYYVSPIYEKHRNTSGLQTGDIGAKNIFQNLLRLMRRKNYHFGGGASDLDLAQHIVEEFCRISLDPENEIANLDQSKFTMPDGNTIDLGEEIILAPEILFDPAAIGKDCPSILESLTTVIDLYTQQIGEDPVVIVSGGATKLPGFVERIQSANPGIEIIGHEKRAYLDWIGVSYMVSAGLVQPIKKSEYLSMGSSIVHKYFGT